MTATCGGVGWVMALTVKEIRKLNSMYTVSHKDGIFTVREEFFYTHGKTAQDLINKIKDAFQNIEIIDSGEIWKPFRGGASTANSSHWFVRFKEVEKSVVV